MFFNFFNKDFHSFQGYWICSIICRFISRCAIIIRKGINLSNLRYNLFMMNNKIKGILKILVGLTRITYYDTYAKKKDSPDEGHERN